MKKAMRTATVASLTLVCILAAPARAQTPVERVLALKGAKIYTSPDVAPIANGTVVVGNNRIVAVGESSSTPVPRGAYTIDCTGMVVTAGFQNSHVHFTE